ALGPIANAQVVRSLRDLAGVGPVVLGEAPPRPIDGHYGARAFHYGRLLGQLLQEGSPPQARTQVRGEPAVVFGGGVQDALPGRPLGAEGVHEGTVLAP